MDENALLIAEAISSLKDDGGTFRNYLFPLISGFFSAILGAAVAYFSLRHHEGIEIERQKLEICNKWIIEVEGLFQSLVAFKEHYIHQVSSDPVERAVKVPTIINHNEPVQINFAELAFVTPLKDRPDHEGQKWRQISRIRGMIENYNAVLKIWNHRNSIEHPLKEHLIGSAGSKPYAELHRDQIVQILGERNIATLVDVTEKAIHLTDDLIIELNDFLNNFHKVAKDSIEMKKVKRYGPVLSFDTDSNPYLQNSIKRAPEVNIEMLASIFGIPVEEATKLYDNGY